MKNFTFLPLFLIAMLGLCSCYGCSGKINNPTDSLEINDSTVMKYVICQPDMINGLIAKGDSIYSQTGIYTIENIGFEENEHAKYIKKEYGDTICVIASIYDTYDVITRSEDVDEPSAAFIWHEVAKTQITKFLRKEDRRDIYKFLCTCENFLSHFEAGTQGEMTTAAWRKVMIADYLVLDAYKQLMDRFPSEEVKQLAHEDYKFVIDVTREYIKRCFENDDYYSDLSRELYCQFYNIILSKAISINNLIEKDASDAEVIQNLREHICTKDEESFQFSNDMIYKYPDESYIKNTILNN